ncbi:MAG: hypothetical protein HWE30_15150 [Methylocystaceae bacterium]|nr:hypothetical protein [Methylocystaceae bacterium]
MAISSVIAVHQDGRASYVSRNKPDDDAKTSSKEDDNPIEDTIDLGVGENFRSKIEQASRKEELLDLLKEGQAQARETLSKFENLLNRQRGEIGEDRFSQRSQILFEATQKTVVEIMMEQTENETSVSVKVSMSFEARLSTNLREIDPDFFEDWKKDNQDTLGFLKDVDWEE